MTPAQMAMQEHNKS